MIASYIITPTHSWTNLDSRYDVIEPVRQDSSYGVLETFTLRNEILVEHRVAGIVAGVMLAGHLDGRRGRVIRSSPLLQQSTQMRLFTTDFIQAYLLGLIKEFLTINVSQCFVIN